MAIVRSFHRHRGETSFTLQQLIAILEEQLPLIAPEQTRYRVTTVPTERTIRFYTGQGLVDKPVGRDRQQALYGYRHLLQILVIKYLQSHYLPLRKIRALVENAGNRDLEQLIPEIASANWAHRGLVRDDRKVPVDRGRQAGAAITREPAAAGARDALPGPTPDIDAPAAAADLGAWHRLEAAPGIELHVHEAALAPAQRERLRGALLRELGVLRGWFNSPGRNQD
ncbi:MAG TPA: MerR family transcriptional regulator [bacterium]